MRGGEESAHRLGKGVSCGNVPVENNANRFSFQKAISVPFHGRQLNPHQGGLVK